MTTFQALSHAGAVVMVHFVEEGARARIGSLIAGLDDDERPRVLESLSVDGRHAVVTKFIMDFVSLENWLQSNQATARPPSAPPPPPPLPPPTPLAPAEQAGAGGTGEPGEFTRLFRAADAPAETGPAVRADPPQPTDDPLGPPTPPPPAPAAPKEPTVPPPSDAHGEFTRLFGQVTPPPPEPIPAPPEPPEPSRPPAPEPPRPEPPPAPPRPTAWPPGSELPGWPTTPDEPAPETPPLVDPRGGFPSIGPSALPPREPGRFTEMFRSPTVEPSDEPPRPAEAPGSRDRVDAPAFGEDPYLGRLHGDPGRASDADARTPPPPPPPQNIPTGPGEYTRVISSADLHGASAPRPPAPPPFSTSPPPPARSSPGAGSRRPALWLGLGIAAIVLLAVVMVLLFVLLGRSGA